MLARTNYFACCNRKTMLKHCSRRDVNIYDSLEDESSVVIPALGEEVASLPTDTNIDTHRSLLLNYL